MRQIKILAFLIFIAVASFGQDTSYSGSTFRNTVAIRNQLVVNRIFRLPKDTITLASNGSVAYLPDGIYFKDTTWKKIVSSGGGGGGSQTLQQVITTGASLTIDNTITEPAGKKLRIAGGTFVVDSLSAGSDHHNRLYRNELYGNSYVENLNTSSTSTGIIYGKKLGLNSPSTEFSILQWTNGGASSNDVSMMFNGDGTDGPKYGQLGMTTSNTSGYNSWVLNLDMRGGVSPFRYFGRKYGSSSMRSIADWMITEDGNTVLGSNTDDADGKLQVTGNARVSGTVRLTPPAITDSSTKAITSSFYHQAILAASATLDFPSTSAQSTSGLTISVPGASVGDAVAVGYGNASTLTGHIYSALVSSNNVVTVVFLNGSSSTYDPASATFTVRVIK